MNSHWYIVHLPTGTALVGPLENGEKATRLLPVVVALLVTANPACPKNVQLGVAVSNQRRTGLLNNLLGMEEDGRPAEDETRLMLLSEKAMRERHLEGAWRVVSPPDRTWIESLPDGVVKSSVSLMADDFEQNGAPGTLAGMRSHGDKVWLVGCDVAIATGNPIGRDAIEAAKARLRTLADAAAAGNLG